MALITNDFGSNREENFERWAPILRPGSRNRIVFDVLYSSKKSSWTNAEIAAKTRLSQKVVSEATKALLDRTIITRGPGTVAHYSKRQDIYCEKKKLLGLAGDRKKLKDLPTKRKNGRVSPRPIQHLAFRSIHITVDGIDSFSEVRKIDMESVPVELVPARLPEDEFKFALELILSEQSGLKDWGGENLDLFSTHLYISGKRKAVGIALKGPGKTGNLTPRKMGKNGDQIDRLLSQAIDVAIVQYEGQVAPSVFSLMEKLSREKARSEQKNVYFCIIDKADSYRLRLAYPKQFQKASVLFKNSLKAGDKSKPRPASHLEIKK